MQLRLSRPACCVFLRIPPLSSSTENIKTFFPCVISQSVCPSASVSVFILCLHQSLSKALLLAYARLSICFLHLQASQHFLLRYSFSCFDLFPFVWQVQVSFPSKSAFRAMENYLIHLFYMHILVMHIRIQATHTDANMELTFFSQIFPNFKCWWNWTIKKL